MREALSGLREEYKPLSEFPRNRRTKNGFATYCKPCHNARGDESRKRLYGSSRHYHLKRRYGIGNGGLGQFGDDAQRLYRAAFSVEDAEQRPGDVSRLAEAARERVEALRGSPA
jgi:hypothetical protein